VITRHCGFDRRIRRAVGQHQDHPRRASPAVRPFARPTFSPFITVSAIWRCGVPVPDQPVRAN
jgi:hypothetical protein